MPVAPEMKDHVYKILELVGSSEKSIDDAIRNALTRASKTIRDMKWFEVVQTRGYPLCPCQGRDRRLRLRIGPSHIPSQPASSALPGFRVWHKNRLRARTDRFAQFTAEAVASMRLR